MKKEVAKLLGVNNWTVLNWERGHTQPPIVAIPVIRTFLGYDPFAAPKTVPEKLLAKRRIMGWSIRKTASVLGVDPGTWRNWERGETILYRKHRARIAQLFRLSLSALNGEMASRWNESHERVPH